MRYKGISITKDRLLWLLITELEYEPEEVIQMTEHEMIEAFVESGMFENESEFAGIFDAPRAEYVSFDDVSHVTGIPVSLVQFEESLQES